MNNGDKAYTEGIQVKSKFSKWLDNYWYHYKWITIGAAFLIIVLIVGIFQATEKKKEDVTILYSGRYQLSAREVESIRNVFNAVMPEDFDGNGEKYTGIVEYQIYSEEQIKEIEAETDEVGVHFDVNNQHNTTNYGAFYDYVKVGESAICLLDPWLYKELNNYGRLLPIATALGDSCGYEEGVNGVYLEDTALYKEYSALRALPADTVICFLRQPVLGKIANDESYQNEIEMLRAILTYTKDGE